MEFELPNFACIGGLNGSGKSQLLEIIFDAQYEQLYRRYTNLVGISISLNGQKIEKNKITIATFREINTQAISAVSVSEIGNNKIQLINHLRILIQQGLDETNYDIKFFVENLGVNGDVIYNIFKNISLNSKKLIYEIDESDVEKFYPSELDLAFQKNTLLQNLSKRFVVEIDRFKNEIVTNRNIPNYILSFKPVWDEYNEEFIKVGFPYQFIDHGLEALTSNILPKIKKDKGVDSISLTDLSSGEQIIFTFISYLIENKSYDLRPEIMLLDEADALLNPSILKNYLEILKNISSAYNIKIIMTSHSPNTFALLEENDVYWMNFFGSTHRIVKKSKSDILDLLCEGLVVVSDNTKFIYLEGETDNQPYTDFANLLGYNNFIFDSLKGVKENQNRDSVIEFCKFFDKFEIKNKFGIVDLDNNPLADAQKSHSLFQLDRYTIENYLYDPIWIYAYYCRKKDFNKLLNLSFLHPSNHHEISKLSNEQIQEISNMIFNTVLSEVDKSQIVEIQYVNDIKITVPIGFVRDKGKIFCLILK